MTPNPLRSGRVAMPGPFALCMIVLMTLLASPLDLVAQHDLRISPELVSTTVVPDSLRFQAAFVAGLHRLLAFTTTCSDGRGGVIGQIRAVHLDSIRPSDEIVLSSSDARPSGGMAIRAWGAGAAVLWSDVRGGVRTIYGRVLDADLAPSGPEFVVCPGAIASDSAVWLLDRGNGGALLIWNRPDRSGAVATLSRDLTTVAGDSVQATDIVTHVRVLPALPGALLLVGAPGKAGYLVRDDGILDPRPVPETIASGGLVVNADSSAGVQRGAVLEHYASVFDAVPVWSQSVSVGGADYIPDRVLTTDVQERYVLYFSGPAWYHFIWVPFYRARFSRDGTPVDTALIDTIQFVEYRPSDEPYTDISNFQIVTGCDEIAVRFIVQNRFVSMTPSHLASSAQWSDGFVITSAGEYVRRRDSMVGECGTDGWVPVTRSIDRARNSFSVAFPDRSRTYAYIAVGDYPAAAQTLPHLIGAAGSMVWLSYRDDAAAMPDVVAQWSAGSADTASVVDGGEPPSPVGSWNAPGSVMVWRDGEAYVMAVTGSSVVSDYTPPYDPQRYTNIEFAAMVPTPTGWKRQTTGSTYPIYYHPAALARVPLTGDVLIAANGSPALGSRWRAVELYNAGGSLLWSARDGDLLKLGDIDHLIPLDDHRYLAIGSGRLALLDTGHLIRSLPFSDTGAGYQYWSFSGGRMLLRRPDVASLILQVFDTSGVIIRNASFPLSDVGDIAVVERPDSDLIVVAAATPHGVRGLFLSEKLIARRGLDSVQLVDVPLSETRDSVAHPTMIVQGDSVVTAWEDFRNGNPDIYGAVLTAPPMLDAKEESSQPVDSPPGAPPGAPPGVTMSPNPAASGLAVGVQLDAPSDISIDLVDPLGRRLLHQSLGHLNAGSYQYHLDLEDVAAGTYFVTVTAAGGLSAQPIVVTRR